MNHSLTRGFTKITLAIFLFVSVFSNLSTGVSFAQSPSPEASQETGAEFTFPINELGGCTDLASCTSFCEDPVNYNSCANFARQNGFYEDDPSLYGDDEFWQETQNQLGCNSAEACFEFCSQSVNFDACNSYSQTNNIPGGYTNEPDSLEYLEIAQTTLGCNSAEACATHCDDPANAEECTNFAREVGLIGGTTQEGPGGCQTSETCSAYCSDPNNFGECSVFAPNPESFTGPGGCTDEASCRSFCEENPDACRSYAAGSNGVYVPVACPEGEYHGPGGVCTAVSETQAAATCVGQDQYWDGSSCLAEAPIGINPEFPNGHFEPRPDMGNCTTPGECYDFCQSNQDAPSCGGFDPIYPRPVIGDEYTPYVYYTPGTEITHDPVPEMGNCTSPASCYDYCSENPESCEGFNQDAPRPPDVYIPGTYYTPPIDTVYVTPPVTSFYTTPIYYTPPAGSTYTTPQYYTPGTYSTPSYYTPPTGSNYVTPNYYTPWDNYPTPTGEYPTPTYSTPNYYTPPIGSGYATPYYYTPPAYTTPYYFTPPTGSNYTTPSYSTPAAYPTPQYYTPYSGAAYTTPVYFTPPTYSTPTYHTPPTGSTYTSPSYYTPPTNYTSPSYYTPGQYPTPAAYTTPPAYTTPQYFTPPAGSNYTTPSYYTPASYPTPSYHTPPAYTTPSYYTPYSTPTYPTPPSGSTYTSPTYYTPYNTPSGTYPTPSYVYPTPGTSYSYPSPTTYSYPTPSTGYTYPSPNTGYSYPTPGGYGTPSYGTPTYGTPSYGTPEYSTPTYGTPEYTSPAPYGTPEYPAPSYAYPTPTVQGVQTCANSLFGLICLPW